jgi:hypothetical protein
MAYMNIMSCHWIDKCTGTLHVPYELSLHAGVELVFMVFIDDILVYLKSMEEHEEHLRIVLQ